jgi:hypothetical protein
VYCVLCTVYCVLCTVYCVLSMCMCGVSGIRPCEGEERVRVPTCGLHLEDEAVGLGRHADQIRLAQLLRVDDALVAEYAVFLRRAKTM